MCWKIVNKIQINVKTIQILVPSSLFLSLSRSLIEMYFLLSRAPLHHVWRIKTDFLVFWNRENSAYDFIALCGDWSNVRGCGIEVEGRRKREKKCKNQWNKSIKNIRKYRKMKENASIRPDKQRRVWVIRRISSSQCAAEHTPKNIISKLNEN